MLGLGLSEWGRIEDEDALAAWATHGRGLAARLLHWCYANGCEDTGRCAVAPLGRLAEPAIEGCLTSGRGTEFIARPVWEGRVRETDALARESHRPLIRRLRGRYGNGLLPRLAARVCELAGLPGRIEQGIRRTGCHAGGAPRPQRVGLVSGIGRVVAARGLLIHRVELRDAEVTEGEDKPLKYPDMFHAADLMILNKIDLLPFVEFDRDLCIDYARRVNPRIKVLSLSAASGQGMDAWLDWIRASRQPLVGHALSAAQG